MPVYQLSDELIFPNPENADPSGLLAVGGDLRVERLVLAYANGIFPWYSEGEPIMWWSPNPRMVLFPDDLKISKSLHQAIRNKKFEVRFDQNFLRVIEACSETPRNGQPGTWITNDMIRAYVRLYEKGFAHSVEIYINGNLSGGLYGLSLGAAFFGESMFFKVPDASKIALVYLVEKIKGWGFKFIDAQIETEHLKRMGAINISRNKFLNLLKDAMKYKTKNGKW